MRVSDFDFDASAERIALAAGARRAMRRGCSWSADGLEDRIVRDLPALLRPGDVLVFNDTKVIPAALEGQRVGRRGTTPKISASAAPADRCIALDGLREAGKKLEAGRPHPLRRGGPRVPAWRTRGDGRSEGRGAARSPRLRFFRAGAGRGDRRHRRHAAAALYRGQACDGRRRHARTTRRSMRAKKARWRRRRRDCTSLPDLLNSLQALASNAEFVTLHVGAGTFLPVKAEDTARPQDACGMGRGPSDDAARRSTPRAPEAAGSSRSAPLRCGCSRPPARAVEPFTGTTDIFITPATASAPSTADDQFPSAALDAVHAGLRLRRNRSA